MITLQQAKGIVHSQSLTARDQLLVLLAVEPGGATSVVRIKNRCAEAGLRKLARKNISDVLSKANGFVARTAEGWELQESGQARVEALLPAQPEGPPTPTSSSVGRRNGLATTIEDVLVLLSAFPDCVGYSRNRRSSPILSLTNEADVQDLIYFMLRPAIVDLVPEQPVANATRQYSLEDYLCRTLGIVIEAKYVRSKQHAKELKTELYDDIGEYKADVNCQHVIFFIYDPDKNIESPTGLRRAVEGIHTHNGKTRNVHCIVHT